MTATLEQVQAFVEKESVVHLIQEDNTLKEVTGTIKVANEVGIGFKEKGKSGIELLDLSRIEEIGAAPSKPKTVSKKKLLPVADEAVRQHLADRHGIELKWCREATDAQAVEFHNSIDHANLGHDHTKAESKDEELGEALADADGS
jgi:hypothetical protein